MAATLRGLSGQVSRPSMAHGRTSSLLSDDHVSGRSPLFAMLLRSGLPSFPSSRNGIALAPGTQRVLLLRLIRSSHAPSGFSLLELVVVIAILGVLTAVSLPALMGNTERARVVAAKAAIQNAISECAVAKQDGKTQLQLTFAGAGGELNQNLVPSLYARPDGYEFDASRGGCHGMYLMPVDGAGNRIEAQGYPILQAKIGAKGRIVKAFQKCQPTASIDLTADCRSWDSAGATLQEDCSALGGARRRACETRNANADYSSNRIGLNDPNQGWDVP